MGGLGIQNPIQTADIEFRNSVLVTTNLTALIKRQETDLSNYNRDRIKLDMSQVKAEKEEAVFGQLHELKDTVTEKMKRSM